MRIGTNNVLWCVCLYLGLFLFCVFMCVCAVGQHNGSDWSCLPQPTIARMPRQNIPRQARLSLLLSLQDVRWKRCHNMGKPRCQGTIHTFTTKHWRDAKALKPADNWPRLLGWKPKMAKGRNCQNTSRLMADIANVGIFKGEKKVKRTSIGGEVACSPASKDLLTHSIFHFHEKLKAKLVRNFWQRYGSRALGHPAIMTALRTHRDVSVNSLIK